MPASYGYFSTTKKGEIYELRQDLISSKEEKKKEAVKQLIASMAVGKDMSSLFTEVLNCIQTSNLELKKLVYLYIMNYAKLQPEQAILAVNTFQKDSNDKNPLVRALAIRTMACIRVKEVIEYFCEPLGRALSDPDPYVLKEAALCVAKLYDIDPAMVEEQGFLNQLYDLLGHSNPMVIVNAVTALYSISEVSEKPVLVVKKSLLFKLLSIFDECTEWGQIFIFSALTSYVPQSSLEASNICSRISLHLQHANSALVLACSRALLHFMNFIYSSDTNASLCQKIAPPLVTLLSRKPEIQYVVLRNINLITQLYPTIFQNSLSIFYCKYNDCSYVKAEKLEMLVLLANEENYEHILLELKEYIREADLNFVSKSIEVIGRCAIKLKCALKKVTELLAGLVRTKVPHILQHVAVVVKDLLRKYPGRLDQIVSLLCEDMHIFSELDAKTSMIWMIGEYADKISQPYECLKSFVDNYLDEPSQIQLQLQTSSVKVYLKLADKMPQTRQLMQTVLNMALQTDHPDVRDRAYIYSRLLSIDVEDMRQIVLAEKPLVVEVVEYLTPYQLKELLPYISMLASVYHKLPTKPGFRHWNAMYNQHVDSEAGLSSTNRFGIDTSLDKLNKLSGTQDLYIKETYRVLDSPDELGVRIDVGFVRSDKSKFYFLMSVTNCFDQATYGPFYVKFAPNYARLVPVVSEIKGVLLPCQTLDIEIPCCYNNESAPFSDHVQVFLDLNFHVEFDVPLPIYLLFKEQLSCSPSKYLLMWENIQNENAQVIETAQLFSPNPKHVVARLLAYNLSMIITVTAKNGSVNHYMIAQIWDNCKFLFEFTFFENYLIMTLKCDETSLKLNLEQVLSHMNDLLTKPGRSPLSQAG
ncbi:AP-1 complex subunit beta-like [Schistocerca gregaria]|uniref:AP-1 complex subunit beta-like n=1 Tax=Schistocerca gregaria TaxID=7010 RepID=UPI00211EE306|nr:AP-1 complex subunit beta-like [Schistocerca gregaria]